MTQQTLTRQIVHDACKELHAQVGAFTYKELHAHIGHGTMSNVHRWGREWRATQAAPARFETLPNEFTRMVVAMAVKAWDSANELSSAEEEAVIARIERENSDLRAQIVELEGQLGTVIEERDRFEADALGASELEEAARQAEARSSHLEEELAGKEDAVAELNGLKATLTAQVADLEDQIVDLSSERDRHRQDAKEAEELSHKLDEATANIAASRAAFEQLEQEKRAVDRTCRELHNSVQELQLSLATGEAREDGLREQVALLKSQLAWEQTNQNTLAEA